MTLTTNVLAVIAKLLSGSSVAWSNVNPIRASGCILRTTPVTLTWLVLWASLPKNVRALTRPVAAKDYWEKGWIRRYIAKNFHALLIDRRKIKVHQSPVDLMIHEIRDKYSLIVFPEGREMPARRWPNSRAVCIIWERNVPIWSWSRSTLTI